MHTTLPENLYDSFTGPVLDRARWNHLEYPMPDGTSWECAEPRARTKFANGTLTVEVDRFENEHPAQIIDNCKHVLLSSSSFPVPETGEITISAQIAATSIKATPFDYRDGFASLIAIEPSTGLVFDLAATTDQILAIHERLPVADGVPCFTRMVGDPLAKLATGPGLFHHFRMTFNASAGSVKWYVDDALLFEAVGVAIPASVHIGLGMFTLHQVGATQSRSLHGQGLHASWRDVQVTQTP